jgi:hypothetical protein
VNGCNQNAEGVREFQPRATPWENRLIWPMKTLKEFAGQNSIGGPGSAPDGGKDLRTLSEFT